MASNAQDSTTCAQLLFEGQLPWPASHVTNAFNYIKNGVSQDVKIQLCGCFDFNGTPDTVYSDISLYEHAYGLALQWDILSHGNLRQL